MKADIEAHLHATKEELRELVQQHFANMGKTMSDGDEESIEAWVSSVMLYFSDYPRTDLFPEEIREEHAEARRLCGRSGGPPLQKKGIFFTCPNNIFFI